MKHIWNIKLHSLDQWFPNGGPNVCFQTNNSTQYLQTAKKCIRFKTSQNCVTPRKLLAVSNEPLHFHSEKSTFYHNDDIDIEWWCVKFLHDLKSEFEAQFTNFDKIGYVYQD